MNDSIPKLDFLSDSPVSPDPNGWKTVFDYDFSTMADGPFDPLSPIVGDWYIKDGLLHSGQKNVEAIGLFTTPVFNDVRIEINGFVDGDNAGELSSFINAPHPDYHQRGDDGYCMQSGADSGGKNIKIARNTIDVAYVPGVVFKKGEMKKVTAERVGALLRIYIDDTLRLEHYDPFPLTGVYTGLYVWGSATKIKRVTAYSRQTPAARLDVEPYGVLGRAFYNVERRDEARQLYEDMARAQSQPERQAVSRYKQAIIEIAMKDARASDTASALDGTALSDFRHEINARQRLSEDDIPGAVRAAAPLLKDGVASRARKNAAMAFWTDLRGRRLELETAVTHEDKLTLTEAAIKLSLPYSFLIPMCFDRCVEAGLLEMPAHTDRQVELFRLLRQSIDPSVWPEEYRTLYTNEANLLALRWRKDAALAVLDVIDAMPGLNDENRLDSLIIRANALYRVGELDAAEAIYLDILKRRTLPDSNAVSATFGLARIYRRIPGKVDESLALSRSVALDPTMPADYYVKNMVQAHRVLIQLGRYDEAIQALMDIEMRAGNNGDVVARAVVAKSIALALTECLDESIDSLEGFLDDFPNVLKWSDSARCLLGLFYLARGDADVAALTVARFIDRPETAFSDAGIIRDRHRLFARLISGPVPDRKSVG